MRHIKIHPLLPRLMLSISIGFVLILFSLGIGVWGYHVFLELPWVDAFLNAAMILSGMGPVAKISTVSGKIFAACYALFSGLFLILIVGIIASPAIHFFFQRIIHIENKKDLI